MARDNGGGWTGFDYGVVAVWLLLIMLVILSAS